MKKAITVLLLIISASIFTFFALAASDNTKNKQPAISGIVTDTNGIPLKDVEVSAHIESSLSNLYHLICPITWTDENGRFSIHVDFPDIRYNVSFRYRYSNYYHTSIVPSKTDDLRIQLKTTISHAIKGKVILEENSIPVAGATVKYFRSNNKLPIETKTNDNGEFNINYFTGSEFEGGIFAEYNMLYSPMFRIKYDQYEKSDELQLKISDKNQEVWGYVRDAATNKPKENIVVVITADFMSGYTNQTTTDKNGLYRFSNLPPTSYHISIQDPDYFMFKQKYLPEIHRKAGSMDEVQQIDLFLKKKVIFEGKVVDIKGKPIEGAIVGIDESKIKDWRYSPIIVRTDKKGIFTIKTDLIDNNPPKKEKGLKALTQIYKNIFKKKVGTDAIEAFDSKGGYGKFQFSPYREGDVVKGIKIVLNGYIRIYGKVTDPKGNPLDKVNITATTGHDIVFSTDELGRYDLGKLPIYYSQIKQGTITFFAPRPGGTSHYPGENQWINDINNHAEKTGFFHHHQETYNIIPEKDIEINVSLEPTDLITLYGTVTDSDNVHVENKDIYLFGGNEAPNTWFKKLNLNGIIGINDNAPLRIEPIIHLTKTDTKGYWKIILARETPADLKITHHMDLEPGHFSIGIYKNNNEHALIKDIIIDPNETQKEINIKLEKDK